MLSRDGHSGIQSDRYKIWYDVETAGLEVVQVTHWHVSYDMLLDAFCFKCQKHKHVFLRNGYQSDKVKKPTSSRDWRSAKQAVQAHSQIGIKCAIQVIARAVAATYVSVAALVLVSESAVFSFRIRAWSFRILVSESTVLVSESQFSNPRLRQFPNLRF